MHSLIRHLDKKGLKSASIENLCETDICLNSEHDLMGLVLKEEFLLLKYKEFYSYRIKFNKSGFLPLKLIQYKRKKISKDYLEEYFRANEDNPYALNQVIVCMMNGFDVTNLTQFPPLSGAKDFSQKELALDSMYQKAQILDVVFTYDRASGIHQLIRKIDHTMWAHTGLINKNREIDEITTSGNVVSPFSSLYRPNLVVGLYRVKNRAELTKENMDMIQGKLDEDRRKIIGYNWFGVFRLYLKKRWKLPLKEGPSPGDLMRMNILELIAYA